MAVPALPADDSTGNDWTAAKVNAIYDHLQWHRDTAPVFKGQAYARLGSNPDPTDVLTATSTMFGFGNAGSFENTPVINIGGWTVQGSDANPESLVVPESGIYVVSVFNDWESNSSGYRSTQIILNGSSVSGGRVLGAPSPSGSTMQNLTTVLDLAANDELDVSANQGSGSTLTATVYLTAHWIRST